MHGAEARTRTSHKGRILNRCLRESPSIPIATPSPCVPGEGRKTSRTCWRSAPAPASYSRRCPRVIAIAILCIRMQLLASGGQDDPIKGPRWSARTFPARFALVETVRAWGEWRRANPAAKCRLALHVVDPSVSREISSGRIDIVELLQPGSIRFWAEIVENGVLLERRLFHKDEVDTAPKCCRRPRSAFALLDICGQPALGHLG